MFFYLYEKFMKCPQTKYHADTMRHSIVIRSKKKSKVIIRSKFIVRSKCSCSRAFFSLL